MVVSTVESSRKRALKKLESLRKSVTAACSVERNKTQTPRYLLKSMSKENKKPPIAVNNQSSVISTGRKPGAKRVKRHVNSTIFLFAILFTADSGNLLSDDFYFSALNDDEEVFPLSDEKYTFELQLQEVLMSSAISSRVPTGLTDWQMFQHFNSRKSSHKGKEKETGESSNSQTQGRLCLICMDVKPTEEIFTSNGCTHLFGNFVAVKIQENILVIKCPELNCKVIDFGSQKFYCPFQDCSAMFVDDGGHHVVESECPNCHRLFSAKCKVAWHAGISCSEFQNLSEDERASEDIMIMELDK
ncbi:RING/U-box superfamily protein [Theobroma cacao]|uniref:RBR-type E3 ubiquitin transferase n=1 Tax=Theobroma cacao TaxID=3641 RepID=A0A061GCR7_THECC|nr:RING/U-box superfamily protein [Theobroma cacao]